MVEDEADVRALLLQGPRDTGPCAGMTRLFELMETRWAGQPARSRDSSGACVTAAVVLGGRTLVVGNVGDARTVLLRPRAGGATGAAAAEILTEDHRAADAGERARILRAGGFVSFGRVMGVLEPSRTIGDLDEKSTERGRRSVIAVPAVR
jgi:serine/threonine protein phosphatase PrpC